MRPAGLTAGRTTFAVAASGVRINPCEERQIYAKSLRYGGQGNTGASPGGAV